MNSDKKAMSKFIEKYVKLLENYSNQNASNESTVETAFKELLIDIGNTHNLTLVKESIKTKSGSSIIPDGILRD